MATNGLWAFGAVVGLVSRCDATQLLAVNNDVSCPRQVSEGYSPSRIPPGQ